MTETLDPLAVPCPDCNVPAGTPCAFASVTLAGLVTDDDVPAYHANRRHVADLRNLEHGTCDLCGHFMVRGSVLGGPLDAWHPQAADAAACPVMPDPTRDWNAYAAALNTGLTPGHPGTDHFTPFTLLITAGTDVTHLRDPLCPKCASGKCINCTRDVLTADDTLEPCRHRTEKVHP